MFEYIYNSSCHQGIQMLKPQYENLKHSSFKLCPAFNKRTIKLYKIVERSIQGISDYLLLKKNV